MSKAREIMKGQIRPAVIKIEEIANCNNCKYNRVCPIPRKRFPNLKQEARQWFNENILNNTQYKDDRKWVSETEKSFELVHWPVYLSENLTGKCEYELVEIARLERMITGRYDLTDPKIFLMTREIMKLLLHAYRCDLILSFQGMHIRAMGKHGPYEILNPIMTERQEYSKLIIDSLEKLDRMIKGQRIDLHLTVHDVLQKLDKYMDDQHGIVDTDLVEKT